MIASSEITIPETRFSAKHAKKITFIVTGVTELANEGSESILAPTVFPRINIEFSRI